MHFNNTDLPDILGPLNVPPIMGITTRSFPVGIGPPSVNESPRSASMWYRKVIVGGVGVFCAMVEIVSVVNTMGRLRKRILRIVGTGFVF
jgi:hypothetical protein